MKLTDLDSITDQDDDSNDDDVCCICSRPATCNYDSREDCPSCGSLNCEFKMQVAMDYHDEVGDR